MSDTAKEMTIKCSGMDRFYQRHTQSQSIRTVTVCVSPEMQVEPGAAIERAFQSSWFDSSVPSRWLVPGLLRYRKIQNGRPGRSTDTRSPAGGAVIPLWRGGPNRAA